MLLVAIAKKSKFRPIFDSFLSERFNLCVTTDILFEYEEIVGEHLGRKLASNLLQLIETAPNVNLITKYYKWHLITQDPDDNKFVDCAIAGEAKFLVSDDKHFKILKQIPFPKVEVLTAETFQETIL